MHLAQPTHSCQLSCSMLRMNGGQRSVGMAMLGDMPGGIMDQEVCGCHARGRPCVVAIVDTQGRMQSRLLRGQNSQRDVPVGCWTSPWLAFILCQATRASGPCPCMDMRSIRACSSLRCPRAD